MARKKKIENWLKLETDWMFQKPIDFEHKKYVLLDFLKKCDQNLNDLKIYPTFIELSLHLANTQTLIKGNNIIYTDKKLDYPDDELMLMDLKYKTLPNIDEESNEEINKIIKYSAPKFFDYFNLAKSIWTMGFDSVNVEIKKNRRNLKTLKGFVFYKDNFSNLDHVWEFVLNKTPNNQNDFKIYFHPIYSGVTNDLTSEQITSNYKNLFSALSEKEIEKLPIIEVTTTQNLPFIETLVPIFKRKILSYFMQTLKLKTLSVNENR
jgi:hypothetical protein